MLMSNTPKVSIILVNYNGKKFLPQCLTSLQELNFPKLQREIIMVDNNSKDLSIKYIRENFPEVRIVESKVNLGFAGGCNLGVRESKGKYVVLLNNDTRVDKEWLSALVESIESNPRVAAVNSKLLLYYPFIELSISSDIHLRSEFTPSINFQSVGVVIENLVLSNKALQGLILYKSGFYEKEVGFVNARWTTGQASILVPCDPNQDGVSFTMTIRSEKSNSSLKTAFLIRLGEKVLVNEMMSSHEVKQFTISLTSKEVINNFLYEVQNTGVVVFKQGFGRDRGAVVKGGAQFYELDKLFYQKRAELQAFSGASVIIRKNIYEQLNGFDESFFMYYEDVDLSLRMKRMGWRILFEPKSIAYHIHSGSSGEWSSLFIYHVEKNHLAVLVKHFPLSIIIREFIRYFSIFILSILKMCKWRLKEHWELYDEWREMVGVRYRVINWIISNFLQLTLKRLIFNRRGKKNIFQVYDELY